MTLVYNELNASQVVTQVCSPDDSGVNIYGGYCNIDGTINPDIAKLNHDTKILAVTNVKFNTDTSQYITFNIDISDLDFVTNYLEKGRLVRYGVYAVWYWAAISSITPVAGGYNVVALALTYDDGWIDHKKLENMIYCEGYCGFQALTMLDKFNSATGFGVGSRRIIKLLNGEYDNCPSMDMSPGGVSIKGLDRNMQPGKCELLKTLCQNIPIIYLGNKETLSTVANDRQIKLGPVSSMDGVSIETHNATAPAIVPPASGRNQSLNNIKMKEYSTNAYPVANQYTTIGTLIVESQAAALGFSFDRLSASELCCITPRGLNLGSGHNTIVSDLLCITTPSGTVSYAFSIGSGATDVRLGNVVCVSHSTPSLSRLFYSPGTGATTLTANTMLIDGYGTYGPAGRTVGSVFVDKLAIRESFLPELNDEVKCNRLIVIPDNEKIFLDKANFNFTIIHPVLLREGIGINKMPESILRLGDKY